MSIQSLSFWQQDQNFWSRSQTRSQSLANSDALISVMSSALTNQAAGLASIANQQALDRVNTQLSAAVQAALQSATGNAASSSGSSSSGNSSAGISSASSASAASSAGSSTPAPATGTGTVPLSVSTPLSTLRIPPNGAITVSDGTNTTTYTSTGTDTVADLINALNANIFGNAQVTASLNNKGDLVITGKYNTETVSVGGTFAPVIGFGASNNTFKPTLPANNSNGSGTSGASSSSAASSASGAAGSAASSAGTSTGSSGGTSTASSSGIPNNSATALQTSGTAEILLASNGLAGTLLNFLA